MQHLIHRSYHLLMPYEQPELRRHYAIVRRLWDQQHSRIPADEAEVITQRLAAARAKIRAWERGVRQMVKKSRWVQDPVAPSEHATVDELFEWCCQASWDLKHDLHPSAPPEAYRAQLVIAKQRLKAARLKEALDLPADTSDWESYDLPALRSYRRWAKATDHPDYSKAKVWVTKAKTSLALRPKRVRRGPGELEEEKRLERKAREQRRAERTFGVPEELDEEGFAITPRAPSLDASRDLWEAFARALDAVCCSLWYRVTDREDILARLEEAESMRDAAWEHVQAMPVPAPAPPPPPKPEPPHPVALEVLAWVRDYDGVVYEQDGLRWVRERVIPWFLQRQRRIRTVAWRKVLEPEEAPGGLGGVWWGFDLARLTDWC